MIYRISILSVVVVAAASILLSAPVVQAIDKCKVKTDKRTGVIQVDASGVGGPLTWGSTDSAIDQAFFNDATCNQSGKAKKCELADPATVASKTPPAGCTIYLDDGVASCSVWIRGCTPGERSPELCVPDANASPRYVDNGDGTVTDYTTCLMWQQTTDDGTVRDKDNLYTWTGDGLGGTDPNGGAFFEFLAELNGRSPFAGHDDWRLPTITELESILDMNQSQAPYIDQTIFGPTASSFYWSSSTYGVNPVYAWDVYFDFGFTSLDGKCTGRHVRAVRGGS